MICRKGRALCSLLFYLWGLSSGLPLGVCLGPFRECLYSCRHVVLLIVKCHFFVFQLDVFFWALWWTVFRSTHALTRSINWDFYFLKYSNSTLKYSKGGNMCSSSSHLKISSAGMLKVNASEWSTIWKLDLWAISQFNVCGII